MNVQGSFNKIGDSTSWALSGGISSAWRVAIRNISGGTVRLEKKADGSVPDASATLVTDFVADQLASIGVAATEVAGQRYRLRCTVAPSAGATIAVRLTDESTSLAA